MFVQPERSVAGHLRASIATFSWQKKREQIGNGQFLFPDCLKKKKCAD